MAMLSSEFEYDFDVLEAEENAAFEEGALKLSVKSYTDSTTDTAGTCYNTRSGSYQDQDQIQNSNSNSTANNLNLNQSCHSNYKLFSQCSSIGNDDEDYENYIRPSLFLDEVKDVTELKPFPVPRLIGSSESESVIVDLSLLVPTITLKSQQDPTVFYRIPVGYGLWDAAHCLTVKLAKINGDLSKLITPPSNLINSSNSNARVSAFECTDNEFSVTADSSIPTQSNLVNMPENLNVKSMSMSMNLNLKNKRVLELGCGVAPLPTLVCAAAGAKYCVATDYLDDLINFAQKNIELNKERIGIRDNLNSGNSTGPNTNGCKVEAGYLKWGERFDSSSTNLKSSISSTNSAGQSVGPDGPIKVIKENYKDIIKGQNSVTKNIQSPEKFDVLLGADVMYGNLSVLEDLAISVSRDLSKLGTILIFSRTIRMGERESYWINEVLIKKYGWKLVGHEIEDKGKRWAEYGRMAHNAKAGNTDRMEILVLVRDWE